MKSYSLLFLFILVFASSGLNLLKAQEAPGKDTLYPLIEGLTHDLSLYKKLKISGYIQAQYQHADEPGIASFAGGNFPASVDQRFAVRRGRIKFTYGGALSQWVMQFDMSEKGVGPKEVYGVFTDPWTKSLSLTAGLMNRDFGYEVSFSSSSRETPERARIFQTLFPGEQDAGMMLTFQLPKTSRFNWFKAEAALFNGSSIATDFDSKKDFLGRISMTRTNSSETVKYGLGLSYYNGGWQNDSTSYYKNLEDIGSGVMAFRRDAGTSKALAQRTYYGIDGQLTFDDPIGTTTFRGEYLTGIQGGSLASTSSPTTAQTSIVMRNFSGALVYFVQNIGETKHQLVFKYDYYDPNTKVSGKEIDNAGVAGTYGKLSKADIKYTTFGIGYAYKLDANVRISAYYDIVKNESTNLTGFTSDVKDNVFTLRIQYKF